MKLAKQRILLIAPFPIAPVQSGAAAYLDGLARTLEEAGAEIHYVWVDPFRFRVGGPLDTQAMRERFGARLHVFESGRVGPFWLRWLTGLWHRISQGAAGRWWMALRRRLDRPGPQPLDSWYPADLDRLLQGLGGDWHAVGVVYVFLSRALQAFPASTLRILETVDVFSHRGPGWFSCTPAEERRGLDRAGEIAAISPDEQRQLAELSGREVHWTGPRLEVIPSERASEPHPTLLLVGSDNPANRAGLRRFLSECWPALRRRVPEVRLWVAGPLGGWLPATPECRSWGSLEDLSELYARSWICLNPDPGGTGISLKSLEALAHGRPLVATPAGARGLGEDFEGALRIAEWPEFSACVADLIGDAAERSRLSRRAREVSLRQRDRVVTAIRRLYRLEGGS